MPPNTPTDFVNFDHDATFDVRHLPNHSKFLSISQQGFPASFEAQTERTTPFSLDVTHLQPDSEDKIYISYDEVHNAVNKTLRPFLNHYKPGVIIAINGGGSFLSMLLGCNVPILSVVVSTGPNFSTNENNVLRVQQWFDESSNEGLRVNSNRVLLLTDAEIAPGMLNFVRKELCARSMPSQVAAVLLHQQQSASASDAMEIVSAMDTPQNAQVFFPWNSDLSYSQHETKAPAHENQAKEAENPIEGYWDWPAENPLSATQIEKHLVSDSKRRQKESNQKVSHSEPQGESYWDWEVKEPTAADALKDIMEYEKIRPTFCIAHIEEKLKSNEEQEDVYEHRSTKNIFLGDNSEYWTWSSESDDDKKSSLEKPLPTIAQEDKIQKLLSVEHTEHQLKQHQIEEECKTPDESPYWSWMSSNMYAEAQLAEYLEQVNKDDSRTPHEEEKTEEVHKIDVNLENEIAAIKNTMNPTELLQWVLDSCMLGLVPSADILRKLLLSNAKKEAIYQPLVDDCKPLALAKPDQKPSSHQSESYWDESPSENNNELDSYWDERPTENAAKNSNQCYWDERPLETETVHNASYWDEAPKSEPERVVKEDTKGISNDNERASVAAYYLTMLNKDASLTATPMNNEDDERASLAAFYRSMSPQVNVTVAPVQRKVEEVQTCAAVLKDETGNENGGYWDEQCSDHDMQEKDEENYWDL